jgi:hypothetical protein
MLDPWQDRHLLLECLRPPEGYRLDRAVGTSYSLDLLALLTAPLAFTFFDWEDEDGRPAADPLALLESARRHADRMHLFCQAGEIKLPPANQRLVAYLEHAVVQVRAPHEDGIFHPKIWLVRYVADSEPVRYRFVCLTRNLTFDRSWDGIVSLDGVVLDRKNAMRANHPLGDFIEALPGLAVRPMSTEITAGMAVMAEEVRRVQFELPEDIEEIAFWPLGITGYSRSPFRRDRASRPLLVMSPFLSPGQLDRLTASRRACFLISRPDQLAAMPGELLSRFKEVFVLNPAAEEAPEGDEEGSASPLTGLHAKVFIEDDGWNARVYLGSANATNSAFSRNVEFVTELVAKKGRVGIDVFLGEDAKNDGMRRILERWDGKAQDVPEDLRVKEELESQLARARRMLAGQALELHCTSTQVPVGLYRLELRVPSPLPTEARQNLLCWPATLPGNAGVRPTDGGGVIVTFGPFALDSVSSFLACELSASRGAVHCTSRFVLNLPLSGVPEDRLQRLLASQLQDRERLLRFLLLLLEAGGSGIGASMDILTASEPGNGRGEWAGESPLFEKLVRGLVDSPKSVENAGAVIDDLARTPEGRAVIPDALLRLWTEIKNCIGETRGDS